MVGWFCFVKLESLTNYKIKAAVDGKRMKSSRIYYLTRSKIKMYQMLCVCGGGVNDSYKFTLPTENREN